MGKADRFGHKRQKCVFFVSGERQAGPGTHGFGLGLGHAAHRHQRPDIGHSASAGFRQAGGEPCQNPGRVFGQRHLRLGLFAQQGQARPIRVMDKKRFILGQRSDARAQALPFDHVAGYA